MSSLVSFSKPALASTTIWGGLISIFPLIWENLPEVLAQVLPVLPPNVVPVVTAVGGIISIFGRVKAKKQISGIVK